MDAADFPATVSMAATIDSGSAWSGTLTSPNGDTVDLGDIGTVYRRRPTQFGVDERMSAPEKAFAYGEARHGFGGVLSALEWGGCLWVNDPAAAVRADYKPVQLAAAAAAGLTIPPTLITSAPHAAYQWAQDLGRPVVYKPLSGVWHADEGRIRALYTSPVTDIADLLDPALARTAHLFQERVAEQFEARAVVVGSDVFTVRIDAAGEEARTDWRRDYDALTYTRITLPDEVASALVELHARLGLVYGAADLICDHTGNWVFLETNQSGEWAWLAEETGIPVAERLADLMEAGPAWTR
ncbi:ATP-grasp ribosomal peptide maturase [Salinactinospora qingdaonensis]|uniref:ATP-grasp ribosomal peptide maturase n=2 Tax=Salinactinospora qingdaonensis TaxID=702744 RepID=A0ABP7FEU0_9ACTN